jgi:hypothetical protein
MKDDADPLFDHMNNLLELAELARHAAPEDRLCLERTIELAGRALLAVTRAQEMVEQAKRLRERADIDMVDRQSELGAFLAELRILQQNLPK